MESLTSNESGFYYPDIRFVPHKMDFSTSGPTSSTPINRAIYILKEWSKDNVVQFDSGVIQGISNDVMKKKVEDIRNQKINFVCNNGHSTSSSIHNLSTKVSRNDLSYFCKSCRVLDPVYKQDESPCFDKSLSIISPLQKVYENMLYNAVDILQHRHDPFGIMFSVSPYEGYPLGTLVDCFHSDLVINSNIVGGVIENIELATGSGIKDFIKMESIHQDSMVVKRDAQVNYYFIRSAKSPNHHLTRISIHSLEAFNSIDSKVSSILDSVIASILTIAKSSPKSKVMVSDETYKDSIGISNLIILDQIQYQIYDLYSIMDPCKGYNINIHNLDKPIQNNNYKLNINSSFGFYEVISMVEDGIKIIELISSKNKMIGLVVMVTIDEMVNCYFISPCKNVSGLIKASFEYINQHKCTNFYYLSQINQDWVHSTSNSFRIITNWFSLHSRFALEKNSIKRFNSIIYKVLIETYCYIFKKYSNKIITITNK